MNAAQPEVMYPAGDPVAIIDGRVVPIGRNAISPAQIVDQLRTVVCRLYTGSDPEKKGMTLIEAALFSAAVKAADGDTDAMTKLLDRLLGKPMQQVANLNMTTTLKEFLDRVSRESESVDPFGD
jgi:hypothetical protein